MITESIIWLVIIIVLGLLIFKLTKSIIKAILSAIAIGILILVVLGAWVAVDINGFTKNFPNQPSIFLLEDNGNILSGFEGVLSGNATLSYATIEQRLSYQQSYDKNDLNAILGSNYRLFIVKKQSLDSLKSVQAGEFNSNQAIFSTALALAMAEKGPLFLIEQCTQGNILVHPETIMFKAIKIIPSSLVAKIMPAKGVV